MHDKELNKKMTLDALSCVFERLDGNHCTYQYLCDYLSTLDPDLIARGLNELITTGTIVRVVKSDISFYGLNRGLGEDDLFAEELNFYHEINEYYSAPEYIDDGEDF